MGYAGKLEEKEKAQLLRGKGYSYGQIQETVHVSKDTLSRWCKDIVLTHAQQEALLKRKIQGQKRGSLIAAVNRRQDREYRIEKIFQEAQKEIGRMSKRDKFIFGLALYAGEGDKTDGKGGFTNANPEYIAFIVKWFREYCNLDTKQLKARIWIHSDKDETTARNYWSTLTGIPENNFYKSYITENKTKRSKRRKNIHPYGVCSVKFHKSDLQRHIMGWISIFLRDTIPDTHIINPL